MVTESKTQEPAPVAESTPATAPKKKSNTTLIIVLVVVFVVVLLPMFAIFGTGMFLKSKVEDAVKNEGITIGDTTISGSEGASWPSTIPSSVPKFTAGTIKASGRVGETWSISIEGVKSADVAAYKTKLTNDGWTIDAESDYGGLYTFTATKGDYMVTPMHSVAENALQLGISKQEPLPEE